MSGLAASIQCELPSTSGGGTRGWFLLELPVLWRNLGVLPPPPPPPPFRRLPDLLLGTVVFLVVVVVVVVEVVVVVAGPFKKHSLSVQCPQWSPID